MTTEGKDLKLLKSAQAFNEAYGLFMLVFSKTEAMMYEVLVKYAGVSDAVGRCIFSGVRLNAMTGFVRAILDSTNAPKEQQEHADLLFSQINTINAARNDLVHYGIPHYTADGPLTPKSKRAKNALEAHDPRITLQDINAMQHDLQVIQFQLYFHLQPGGFSLPAGAELRPPRAWLYKSPQPSSSNQRNRTSAQTQTRQPKSSRAKQPRKERA